MTSCSVPMVLSRASSTIVIPKSRLSHSMLYAVSSRVKDVDAGFYRSTHQSRGAPHVGEPLAIEVRVREDSPPASSAAYPSR